MSFEKRRIILVRHAQSIKNLKDIHGGGGEGLTDLGKEQVIALAEYFSKIGIHKDNTVLVYPPNVQTKQTADILSKMLRIPTSNIPDFKPLNLGIVHGLSNDEVSRLYPDVYQLLIRWRNKELDISELRIPQMENPGEFYARGIRVLTGLSQEKNTVLVSTNSLYILMLNILFGNTCDRGGGYIHFNIPNCGVTVFRECADGSMRIDLEQSNVEEILEYAEQKCKL